MADKQIDVELTRLPGLPPPGGKGGSRRWIALGSLIVSVLCSSGYTYYYIFHRTDDVDKAASSTDQGQPASEATDGPAPVPVPARHTDVSPGHARMLAKLQQVFARAPDEHFYVGDRRVRRLRAELANEGPNTTDHERWAHRWDLGYNELRLGNERRAIELSTQAYELLPKIRGQLPAQWVQRTILQLGVAYFRLGETENCCSRNTPDSCIVPIRGGGIHTRPEGSRRAMRYFSEVLKVAPTNSDMYLQARWLLNLAAMTLDVYPKDVPAEYLIPVSAFESDEPFPRFVNISKRVGLDTFNLSGSAIADDFDNDGYLDMIVSSWDPAEQLRYFHNNRDGSFVERTAAANLTGILGGLNLVQADYDNDGHLDIFVLRGAWLGNYGRQPNSLLRNNGDRTFTDVTFDAGLGKIHYPTQTAAWSDYDRDGDLDLYIGNEQFDGVVAPSQLFRNNGDGTFTDVAPAAGVTNHRFAKGVVWGDFDGDRWPDIYVSNLGEPNRLYHNNGDGTFSDVAASSQTEGPSVSFPTWVWDFDNDGHLDIYVSGYADPGAASVAAGYLGLKHRAEVARLYRGDGQGGFEDVALSRNVTSPTSPMGANFGDLNNDGFLDFYLGTGRFNLSEIMPNVMYLNKAGKRFVNVTTAGGFGHLQKGHGVAFADLDNDGDQDIFEQMGGAVPADKFSNSLYENPGFDNRWIAVKLVGVQTNRSAIGARIRVEIVEGGKPRVIYKHVNSGGSFGANPLRQTIGLGRAKEIVELQIFWPTTGKTQSFVDVPLDQTIRITEGQDRYETIELKKFRLGSSGQP